MKRLKCIIFIIALTLCILPALNVTAATKQINVVVKTTFKLQKGEKIKLYVKGYRNNKNVRWKSSNIKIATVSQKGVVTGKKGGTCKITATIGKRKYRTKIFVISKIRTVFEYDASSADEEDRFDTDFIITDYEYDKYMSESQLKELGLSFMKFLNTNKLYINGQKEESITGMVKHKTYLLTNIPLNPMLDTEYGTDLRYIWNGVEFLYNTEDLIALGLIVE